MFKNNKYKKWYFNIINFRKNNILSEEGEKHHIIPKSLGGNNSFDNIVKLSYREHFVCHLLLTKMCASKDHQIKMLWALHRLTFSKLNFKSHHYELARKIHIKNLIENHPLKNDEYLKKQISIRVKKDWEQNEERRIKTSLTMQNTIEKNREFFIEHNKKASKLGTKAYREKHKYDIEYKGNYFYSWNNLYEKTGVTKYLYEIYYKNDKDPEPFLGRLGPTNQKKWITNGVEDIQWNVVNYPQLPIGYSFGRCKIIKRKENQCAHSSSN